MITITFVIGGINKATGQYEVLSKGERKAQNSNQGVGQAKRRLRELRERIVRNHADTHQIILLTYSGV